MNRITITFFTLMFTLNAYADKPNRCPDINAMKNVSFTSIRNDYLPEVYILKTDKFKFNTNTEWYLAYVVYADSQEAAVKRAHTELKSWQKGPVEQDGKDHWVCGMQNKKEDFGVVASTQPFTDDAP